METKLGALSSVSVVLDVLVVLMGDDCVCVRWSGDGVASL